ncbi:MAG: response regulator [Elusimicrobia bacterium]|nr:response regulator [Elusimicrobiota bacterium]
MNEAPLKALLIEDDAEDTLILMELLAQPGWPALQFTLVCAETLKAGLKLLADGGIDVVLLDLMLPDSQGVEAAQRIRAQAPEVPIVVLTGMRDEAMGLEAVRHGAQDYVVKGSIDGKSLKRIISFAVERHRLSSSFETLIENSVDGMVVIDARNVVRYVNPAAQMFLDRSAKDMLGRTFEYPLPATGTGELRANSGGRDCIAEVRVASITWNNEPARLVSLHDITDIRRVEQLKAEVRERRRMDQLKDELVSTVSHEIRSPLTIIKAAVDNLRYGLAGPLSAPQKTMVQLMVNNTQRLMKVVNNILDLSRLESGKANIQAKKVQLAELVRESVLGFQMIAGEKKLKIENEFPDDLPPVYANPDLLVQVINNLLDNAMRFTKTRIQIQAKEAAAAGPMDGTAHGGPVLTARKFVQISVIDDGAGIPKERQAELFDKFVQLKRRTTETGYKGTGLGLSICKEIIERQQGCIWVESGKGSGTRFNFTLPQFDPARDEEGEATPEEPQK